MERHGDYMFSTKNLFLSSIFVYSLSLITGCATQTFQSKIERSEEDLLSEESFMRYNSLRLEKTEPNKANFISDSLRACHQGKIKKGTSILEENTEKNKTNPEFWNALGTCYLLDNDNNKARFYYQLGLEALSQKKNIKNASLIEAMIKNNLGLIMLKNKRINEAFDAFQEASKLSPLFHTPLFNMAQIYMEYYQNEKAIEILEKLKEKNPKDIDVLYSLAVLYQRAGDYKKSYTAVSNINIDYLNRADIVGVYALNLYQNKELDKAKLILEKRTYAEEFNTRNKMLLELINDAIKAQKN